MKKLFSIIFMAIAMMMATSNICAQAPTQRQRLTREQLAEKQAQHIAHDLALDDKVADQFINTYIQSQKEIWALGPRPRHRTGDSDAQTEQEIKRQFEMSEKILNIRQKYYGKYSKFLTPKQIQRVYEIERNMMKRLGQHKGKAGNNRHGMCPPHEQRQ